MITFIFLFMLIGTSTVHTLRCYQCSFVTNPSACSHFILCSPDEQCFTERRYDGASRVYYTMGCVSTSFCQNANSDLIIGKKRNVMWNSTEVGLYPRDSGCLGCCSTDNCNNDICKEQVTENFNMHVRLTNSNNSYQGIVEVLYNNTWSTICADHWTRTEAKVVCRGLGHGGDLAIAFESSSSYPNTSQSYLVDNVVCHGNESGLMDCNYSHLNADGCQSKKKAGVICREAFLPEEYTVLFFLDVKQHVFATMNTQQETYSVINLDSQYTPSCFDYDAANDKIYFFDSQHKKIYRMNSDGTNVQQFYVLSPASDLYNIKVDSGHGNLFYSDLGRNVISRLTFVNGIVQSNQVLLSSIAPRAIALDKSQRRVFWSHWGPDAKIELVGYDGGASEVKISRGLIMPSCMVVSKQDNRLYFVDYGKLAMETFYLYHIPESTAVMNQKLQFFSLDVFGRDIYFTSANESRTLYRFRDSHITRVGPPSTIELTQLAGYTVVKTLDPASVFVRLMGGADLSRGAIDISVNGQWWPLCSQYWDNKSAQVACNMLGYDRSRAVETEYPMEATLVINPLGCTGYENKLSDCHLSPNDWTVNYCSTNRKAGAVCEGSYPNLDYRVNNFLVFCNASTGGLVRMDMNSFSYTVINITFSKDFQTLSVAYDPFDEIFYVSHVNLVSNISHIIAYNRRGEMIRSLPNIPEGSIIKHLALDTKRNMLYYTDSGNEIIGTISPYGTESRIVASNVTEPSGITLDKERMVIYWTESGQYKRIMKINANGTNQQEIISRLEDPRGITFSQEAQQIFFISGKSFIEYIYVNQSSKYRKATYSDVDLHGLTSTSKYLFFSDLKNNKIMRIDINPTSSGHLESTADFPDVYDITAIQVTLS